VHGTLLRWPTCRFAGRAAAYQRTTPYAPKPTNNHLSECLSLISARWMRRASWVLKTTLARLVGARSGWVWAVGPLRLPFVEIAWWGLKTTLARLVGARGGWVWVVGPLRLPFVPHFASFSREITHTLLAQLLPERAHHAILAMGLSQRPSPTCWFATATSSTSHTKKCRDPIYRVRDLSMNISIT
jgi:hypothetical protein